MTIESYLTRELDIRFIDARTIATEAKINLGISGYPTAAEITELQREAVVIFEDQPTKVKSTMRRQQEELEAIKEASCSSSNSSSSGDMGSTSRSNGRDDLSTTESTSSKRKSWFTRRNL